jgi:hypothetical protein
LSGIVSEKRFFQEPKTKTPPTPEEILQARSYSDWLGTWFARHISPRVPGMQEGQDALLRWQVHADEAITAPSDIQQARKWKLLFIPRHRCWSSGNGY